jgi:hypothetical protein
MNNTARTNLRLAKRREDQDKMNKPNEVIKVSHIMRDGRAAKQPFWNVRINGEVHQMWFGTKKRAIAYLDKHYTDTAKTK